MRYKLKRPTERWLIFMLIIIIGIMTGILWSLGDQVKKLTDQTTASSNQIPMDTRQLIIDALHGIYDPVVVGTTDNHVYIPEAKIMMPLNSTTKTLNYTYNADQSADTPQLTVNLKNNIIDLNTFQDVACAQRVADVYINALSNNKAPQAAVKLQDGRTLNVYTNQTSYCTGKWKTGSGSPTSQVLTSLKTAQSY